MLYAFAFLVAIPVMAIYIVWDGYVVMTLWNWFLPEALGIPAITLKTAIMIGLIVPLLRPNLKPKEGFDHVVMWGAMFFGPAIALGIGYAIKFWF